MKDLYVLLVPFSIAVIGFILHYSWKYFAWRKELKRDEKIRKELDRLLQVDDDLQHWYKKEFS